MYCDQIECMRLFLFSYIFWSPFWRKFHRLLRRMYIVPKLDEIFFRHQLGPFDLWCDLVLEFLYWFFVWMTHLLVIGGVLKSPTNIVLKSICAFKSFKVCLMKLGALTLGVCRLIIVISFWFISTFISMKYPSLSHLINVSLNSTPVYFGGPLAW
jgi:hypothetical protein